MKIKKLVLLKRKFAGSRWPKACALARTLGSHSIYWLVSRSEAMEIHKQDPSTFGLTQRSGRKPPAYESKSRPHVARQKQRDPAALLRKFSQRFNLIKKWNLQPIEVGLVYFSILLSPPLSHCFSTNVTFSTDHNTEAWVSFSDPRGPMSDPMDLT